MPKLGYITITLKNEDLERLQAAAANIIGEVPASLKPSPVEALRIVLGEAEKLNQEPEEEG